MKNYNNNKSKGHISEEKYIMDMMLVNLDNKRKKSQKFKITRMENHPDISDTEDYIKSIIKGFLLNVYGYLQHLDTR